MNTRSQDAIAQMPRRSVPSWLSSNARLITAAAAYLSVIEPESLRWTCQGSPSCWTRTGCTVISALSRLMATWSAPSTAEVNTVPSSSRSSLSRSRSCRVTGTARNGRPATNSRNASQLRNGSASALQTPELTRRTASSAKDARFTPDPYTQESEPALVREYLTAPPPGGRLRYKPLRGFRTCLLSVFRVLVSRLRGRRRHKRHVHIAGDVSVDLQATSGDRRGSRPSVGER